MCCILEYRLRPLPPTSWARFPSIHIHICIYTYIYIYTHTDIYIYVGIHIYSHRSSIFDRHHEDHHQHYYDHYHHICSWQTCSKKSWQCVCWITPGKLCLGSLLGNYVLHQPLETVCCQLWSSAFGSRVLVPGFGPTGPMAHGPLGQDVLHHVWHTVCCISAWKLCVASPLHTCTPI